MSDKKQHTMTLTDNATGKSWELPVMSGSVGPKVIDIRKLYGQTGYFTYDPGFTSTASCDSAITYIDGDEGVLLHRGYSIEDLAENCEFMEVCYLLLHGELPNKNNCCISIAASGAMPTRWPLWSVWLAH